MNDRMPMPAFMPAELAEKLSDQWHEEQEAKTDAQLDDAVSYAIEKKWSVGELITPVEGYDYWTARFHKALDEAITHQDAIRYAELGRVVHYMSREAVREEL